MGNKKDVLPDYNYMTDLEETAREKKFQEMFQNHFATMCILADKYLCDYEAARDAVHEVFIKLWESDKEIGNIVHPQSYLYITTKNHCLDILRKQKHKHKEQLNEPASEKENEDFFETEAIREEVYQLLTHAIESLAGRSREIIKLKIAGKKNQEIAEILNISVNTVNTLKTNAYQVLRKLLKDKYMLCWLLFSHPVSSVRILKTIQ